MDIAKRLDELKNRNLYRTLNTLSAPQERQTVINNRRVLLFSSNSYLGLTSNEEIKQKAIAATEKYGVGSGGSRLTTGNYDLHTRLERLIADFKGTESSIVFNCGYMANVGAISSLSAEDDVIFSDSLNHASIIDGCRLSKAKTIVYAHRDIDDLRKKIDEVRPRGGIIVTDGVFSMDGDIAPLPELLQIARDSKLMLMVDDAHATGVIGATGRGSSEHFGLSHGDIDILMGTLSKSVGSEGGFIGASEQICDYLRNTARSFIFSTALSPATIASSIAGIEHIANNPEDVARLQENIAYFIGRLKENGVNTAGETAILPIVIGDENKAKRASDALFEMGVFVPCIRYPTVKMGEARLRFTLMSTHTREDMDYAAECLKKVLKE